MAKLRKGQKLACIPCGREIIICDCGISRTTIWCCGTSMRSRLKTKPKKKTSKKKAVKKKRPR